MHLSLGPHRRRHAGQPEFPLLARGTHPAAASAGKGSHFSFTRELNSIDSAALVGELEVKVKQKLMEHLKGWSCARHGICAPKHISCGSSQNYTWPEIVFLGSFSLSLSLLFTHFSRVTLPSWILYKNPCLRLPPNNTSTGNSVNWCQSHSLKWKSCYLYNDYGKW